MNNMHGSMGNNISLGNQVTSVKLSVEALPESRIQEITLDGTETYFRSLTMSEHLCKLASKIDFLAEEEGRESKEDEEEEFSKMPFQNQRWPWEPIHSRLQQALTEINVLTDVLSITQSKGPPKTEGMQTEGKYMMFDQTRKDVPQIKLNFLLPTKKKGLNAAAEILFTGEKRMKSFSESNTTNSGYHHELLKLRKYWRIRKVGTKVLGDLSYRTVGSDFLHGGNFEVIKTADDRDGEDNVPSAASRFFSKQTTQKSALKVVVGSDLTGGANIKFTVKRPGDKESVNSGRQSFTLNGLVNKADPGWHKILSSAQYVLYCRELFEKLAQQAVQFKTSSTLTPFWVVGNKISVMILPGTDLVIELVTSFADDDNDPLKTTRQQSDPDSIFSLKMAAMHLLIDDYQRVFNIPAPHPAVAVFGLSRVQRRAATAAFSVPQMQRVSAEDTRTLVERLVDMAKHWELKRRVCEAITVLSAAVQDPYIIPQWSTLGSNFETTVRLTILSVGYENCNRTSLNLTVGTESCRAVQRDGKVIKLSSDSHGIRLYLLSLLCLHQLCTAQDICSILGWTIQHFTHHSGIGPRTPLGGASCLMAVSPMGNCCVSLKCWVSGCDDETLANANVNYQVHVQIARVGESGSKASRQQHAIISELAAVQDPKWSLLGDGWREVDLPKLFGRHFIGKFESLITFLRSDF